MRINEELTFTALDYRAELRPFNYCWTSACMQSYQALSWKHELGSMRLCAWLHHHLAKHCCSNFPLFFTHIQISAYVCETAYICMCLAFHLPVICAFSTLPIISCIKPAGACRPRMSRHKRSMVGRIALLQLLLTVYCFPLLPALQMQLLRIRAHTYIRMHLQVYVS